MKTMNLVSMIMSMMFMNVYHPMMLTIITVVQSLSICFMIMLLTKSSWMSYVLFLIFLGGMMIIFVYVCSLSSNEMMKKKLNIPQKTMMIMMIFIMSNMMNSKMYQSSMSYKILFMKMFNKMMMMVTIMLMVYLLLVLVIIVKNTMLYMGPLRTKKMM